MRSRIALLAFLALPLASLGAQLVPYPFEEEAAETIFDLNAGDAEVSLFASGTWDVNVAPGIGWIVSRRADGSRRALPGYEFPGLEPVLFDQNPRLTLSLWLLQRYFFETTVNEEISESTILFGYAGREGESVQSVLVGNTAIGVGAYPYLGFGDETGSVGQDAPGASALFRTPVSEHELMVRFAPAEDAELLYANGGIVSETRVPAGDYEHDRHFVLPDGGLDLLEVYVASADGAFTDQDGKRYRRVDLDRETVYSLTDGTVSFRDPPQTAVLVYYEAGGLPIGNTSLGRQSWFGLTGDGHPSPAAVQHFSFESGELGAYASQFGDGSDLDAADFTRTLTGPGADRTAFLLHEPGRYAPFATAASYALPEAGTSTVTLEYPNSTPYPTSLRLVRIENRSLLTIAAGDDPRAFANRYPLASDATASPVASIYGPGAVDAVNAPEVVFRSVRETDTIVLPSGFIPGSVRITRNGTTETRFVVEDSGRVVFDAPLRRTDVVRIAYRTSAAAGAGDLLFASGNTFAVAPGTAATLALGARWKPVGAAYSTRPGEYPGRLTLSGSLETDSREWREERPYELTAGLEAAVSFASPDTTGVLRLASMSEGGRSIAISPTGLFLAPTPLAQVLAGTENERGYLRHADYSTTNAFGERSLLAYNDPAAPPADAYEAGARGGPYPAASYDPERSGTVAVFDYEIPADRSWVAGLIRVDGGTGTDLSDVRTIVVPYRVLDASGEAVQLRLEIGAIAEDLDDDGTVDTGTNGLSFTDSANTITLTTGAAPPPGFRYTEDANGNGVLDPELPDLLLSDPANLTLAASLDAPTAGWVFAPINVTAAEARRLAQTRAVRVVIEGTTAGTASGRILVGEIDALGAAFATTVTGGDAWVRSRPTDAYPDEPLASAYPEVASRFASGDADPHLLAVAWNTGADTITLSRAAAVPAADYEEIRLYYRAESGNAGGATLSVRARDGSTIVAERSVAVASAGSWGEIVVPLPEDSAAVINRIDIEITTDGAGDGELLLDELSFWAPRATVGSIAEARLAWRPAIELAAGDTTFVSRVSLEQRLGAQTASFPDDLGSTRSGIESSTELGARLLTMDTTVGLDLLANQLGTGRQLRHEVSIPIVRGAVTVRDGFRAGYGLIEPGTTHEAGVQARVGSFLSADAAWLSDQRTEGRVEWSAGAKAEAAGASGARTTASAQVTLDERDVPAGQPASYASSWAQSFTRLAPTDGPQSREASTGLSATFDAERAGVELEAGAGFGVDVDSQRRRVSTRFAIGVPVAIGESMDAALRLSRDIGMETAGVPLSTPGDDVGAAGTLLAAYPLPVAFVPIGELLAADYPERAAQLTYGLLSSRYRPEVAIELRRRIRSSIWSLVVPTGVDLSAARPAERDLASARTYYELTARSVFVAPNLFGRLGTRSLVSFYDTDEFRASLRVSSVGGDGSPWTTDVDFDQTVRLIWMTGRSVSIETVVSTVLPAYDETVVTHRIAHTRTVATEAFRGLPLPGFLAESERQLRHETSLEIDYDSDPAERVLVRLEHGTSLLFGDKGSIRLHGGFGVGTLTVDTETNSLLGLRAGIEGKLSL